MSGKFFPFAKKGLMLSVQLIPLEDIRSYLFFNFFKKFFGIFYCFTDICNLLFLFPNFSGRIFLTLAKSAFLFFELCNFLLNTFNIFQYKCIFLFQRGICQMYFLRNFLAPCLFFLYCFKLFLCFFRFSCKLLFQTGRRIQFYRNRLLIIADICNLLIQFVCFPPDALRSL